MTFPKLIDATPSPAFLPLGANLRRQVVKPEIARPPTFLAAFEDRALVYDAFWHADGKRILLVGPPPINLAPFWRAAQLAALPAKAPLKMRMFLSLSQMIIELRGAAPETTAVKLVFAGHEYELNLPPRDESGFEGRRVLFSMNRNNDLAWIREWALHHVRTQGTDAVILFDNNSDRYGPGEIIETLSSIDGLKAIAVPSWPWVFGPVDPRIKRNPYWARFLQLCSMSVVLRRFGPTAHSLLSCDIDELTYAGPDRSVHDLVRGSRAGFMTFKGQWVEPIAEKDPDRPSDHRTYRFRMTDAKLRYCRNSKWAIDPSRRWLDSLRIHPYWHWLEHRPLFSKERRDDVFYWHFKGINTNWKDSRAASTQFDPLLHEADPVLSGLFRTKAA